MQALDFSDPQGRVLARNFDVPAMTANLLWVASLATPEEYQRGLRWYNGAHGLAVELAQALGKTVASAAGVIAALSINTHWDKNVEYARAWVAGEPVGHFGMALEKAALAVTVDDIDTVARLIRGGSGFKIASFARCIFDPLNSLWVVIDRWAVRAALGMPDLHDSIAAKYFRTRLKYARMAQAYREAAGQLGILPLQLQAIVWLVVQRLAPNKRGRNAGKASEEE